MTIARGGTGRNVINDSTFFHCTIFAGLCKIYGFSKIINSDDKRKQTQINILLTKC